MSGKGGLLARRLSWRAFAYLLLAIVFGAVLAAVFIVPALISGGAG